MPGELIPIVGMLMSGMITLALVAGFFVTRLSKMKSERMRHEASPSYERDIARLESELAQTREEVRLLSERQQFVEQLLEKRPDPSALPR